MNVWMQSVVGKLQVSTTGRELSTTKVRHVLYDLPAHRTDAYWRPGTVRSQTSICPSPGIRE